MGAQIAAHLANAGLEVLLLDVSRQAAAQSLARLRTTRPDPCFVPHVLTRISAGGFDDDAGRLRDADWIIEAVVESLEVKQSLLGKLAPAIRRDAIVSSNTSGIPLATIASALPADLRPRWIGTHFFNPPRYLHLLELIPTPETAAAVIEDLTAFADVRLGKGVVVAKDTPGFIANRIGMFSAIRSIELVASGQFTIEEIDAVTGPIIGRPKSATFRTLDLAGVDIAAKVAADLAARLSEAEGRDAYTPPPLLARMVERGLLGDKTGSGFYRRVKGDEGSTILALDPATLEYRPQVAPQLPSLEAARAMTDTGARIRGLMRGQDRAGEILRATLGPTLRYTAQVAGDIAHNPADIDKAMRWGFGWALGPFETIAAIDEGERIPTIPRAASPRVVTSNAGASLIDAGDDVLRLEFHSKMNTIGGDAIAMIVAGVAEAERNFRALVIGQDAENFSAGANLMLILLEAQEGNWDEIDAMVRAFQGATSALKHSAVPVVAAPAGLALGGGCEICLHTSRVRAAAETYMGLVEVGVGLLPAGGGTREMLLRAIDLSPGDTFPAIQSAFETIGFGKVSTSAPHAEQLGYLRDRDAITMNRTRVLADATRDALDLAAAGYQPVLPRASIPVGGPDAFATLSLGVHLAHRAGRISDHDARIGRLIARVLTGGDVPHRATVTEQHLLDLEREAFLALCGEPRTLERIAYTLKTGKTLRN
jgi:3-hydroxyacyl-CoA dehydrogenase